MGVAFWKKIMLPSNPFKIMFTENDGVSWCPGRFMAAIAFVVLTIKFCQIVGFDGAVAYGVAVTGLIGAVALNKYSESKPCKTS
jgi:hypothetical protein